MSEKRVLVMVYRGCAEILEQPDDIDVIIVDRDGDYPWYCEACENVWGPRLYPDFHDEIDDDDPEDFFHLCPDCREPTGNSVIRMETPAQP